MLKEGLPSFYRGFSAQMSKVVVKPIWRWPMMTEIPKVFSSFNPIRAASDFWAFDSNCRRKSDDTY